MERLTAAATGPERRDALWGLLTANKDTLQSVSLRNFVVDGDDMPGSRYLKIHAAHLTALAACSALTELSLSCWDLSESLLGCQCLKSLTVHFRGPREDVVQGIVRATLFLSHDKTAARLETLELVDAVWWQDDLYAPLFAAVRGLRNLKELSVHYFRAIPGSSELLSGLPRLEVLRLSSVKEKSRDLVGGINPATSPHLCKLQLDYMCTGDKYEECFERMFPVLKSYMPNLSITSDCGCPKELGGKSFMDSLTDGLEELDFSSFGDFISAICYSEPDTTEGIGGLFSGCD